MKKLIEYLDDYPDKYWDNILSNLNPGYTLSSMIEPQEFMDAVSLTGYHGHYKSDDTNTTRLCEKCLYCANEPLLNKVLCLTHIHGKPRDRR